MPLAPGNSKATISSNIREMMHHGHSQQQAIAAALNTARKTRATGGLATAPTPAQKEAGNYKKHHLAFGGLAIALENRKGHWRHGVDTDGKQWRAKLPADYGYIKRTTGADGDHVDCYVGPHKDSHVAFVVDQYDPKTKKFDEHKCFLGFRNEDEAQSTYDAGFSDGSGPRRRGQVHTMSLRRFKEWLDGGDTESPMSGRMHKATGGPADKSYKVKAPGVDATEEPLPGIDVTDEKTPGFDVETGEGLKVHSGPIHSGVAGRTDHLPMHVESGSYVIPADIISAMGEGNTIAGFKQMKRIFGGVPYSGAKTVYSQGMAPYGGSPKDKPYGNESGPYGAELPGRAHGGRAGVVPIVAAGGEYVLTPKQVLAIGKGDLDLGHKVLDEFVKRYRAETIKTLRKLPGPAKD